MKTTTTRVLTLWNQPERFTYHVLAILSQHVKFQVIKLTTFSPWSVELTELPTSVVTWFSGADPIQSSKVNEGRRLLLERGEKEGFAWRSRAESGRVDMLLNLSSGDLLLTRF